MTKEEKILLKVLRGVSDRNLQFNELCKLLTRLGFEERTRGSHRIFFRTNIEEIINLQPKGNLAKPYQVKQVRNLILKYKLGGVEDDKV
ncbi:type II toxin-antitoxin system HicA family toxin [bacterium]|nr:type II toxin-antitoxin system HicA family toxin [bacterium]MBU1881301.1 type II toxin-antitoxin system HicA family toxin [bacterium]